MDEDKCIHREYEVVGTKGYVTCTKFNTTTFNCFDCEHFEQEKNFKQVHCKNCKFFEEPKTSTAKTYRIGNCKRFADAVVQYDGYCAWGRLDG